MEYHPDADEFILEENSPPIEGVYMEATFYERVRENQLALLEMTHVGGDVVGFSLDTRDTSSWRRLGQAISESDTVKSFKIYSEKDCTDDRVPGFIQSLEVLYEGVKQNKSIQSFILEYVHVIYGRHFPLFDYDYFLKSNEELMEVEFGLWQDMTLGQSRVIANAINAIDHGAKLNKITVWSLADSVECYEQVVSACWGVNTLLLSIQNIRECNVIATLLRDPRANVQELILESLRHEISEDEVIILHEGLRRNATVKTLDVSDLDMNLDWIGTLICDASSIESIYSSNHVLQEVVTGSNNLPAMIKHCFEFNKLTGRDKIIRWKIAWFYFTGSFDVQPFLNMPASVLVEVMGMIMDGFSMNLKPFFTLLSCRPDLCSYAGTIQIMFKRKQELMNPSDESQKMPKRRFSF